MFMLMKSKFRKSSNSTKFSQKEISSQNILFIILALIVWFCFAGLIIIVSIIK
jgi:hypothetical protein